MLTSAMFHVRRRVLLTSLVAPAGTTGGKKSLSGKLAGGWLCGWEGESGEVSAVSERELRMDVVVEAGAEWCVWLAGCADMEVLSSSSSLPADCTSIHSGECTLHGQHLSSSHTNSAL